MNDAVNRILMEREALDRGLSGGVVLSVGAHVFAVAAVVVVPLLMPKEPLINVVSGFAVSLPPGGGGTPEAERPAPAPAAAKPAPEPPKPEPKSRIIKPPKDTPKKGLPAPDAKKTKGRAEPSPPRGGMPRGTGTASHATGLAIGVVGPGIPGGTDWSGDWYIASVQQKLWILWNQQLRTAGTSNLKATLSFRILPDGSVTDIRLLTSSGVFLYDQAAQRAIVMAGNERFAPPPRDHEANRYPITVDFKPAP